MKLYIYPEVDGITDNYHDGGALVIITDRDPLDAFNSHSESPSKYRNPVRLDTLPTPDRIVEIPATAEEVYIFADSGCC